MTIKYGEKLQIMQSYYRMGNRIIVIFTYLLCEKHKNNCYNCCWAQTNLPTEIGRNKMM